MFFTYIHRKVSDNSVFYVGMGSKKRANLVSNRSKEWQNVADEHGVYVEICAKWETQDEAYEHERLLISCFREMKHPLVNKSDGKASLGLSRKQSDQERALTSQRMMGNKIWVGRKHKESTKALQRASHLGKPKPQCICLECGRIVGGQSNILQHQRSKDHVGFMRI